MEKFAPYNVQQTNHIGYHPQLQLTRQNHNDMTSHHKTITPEIFDYVFAMTV